MSQKNIVFIDEELEEIVPQYIQRRKNEIPILWKALKAHDFDYLKSVGHKLAGSAGGYGLDTIGFLAEELNETAKKRDEGSISTIIEKMENFLLSLEIVYKKIA